MQLKLKILTSTFLFLLFSCTDRNSSTTTKVNFPTQIYLEKKSPDNKINAIIYTWSSNNKSNLLGSNDKFVLGFTNSKTKWYIDFELSEGFGTYEGGITEIEWLNNNEILIKRTISGQPKDLKYNLQLNEWTFVKPNN